MMGIFNFGGKSFSANSLSIVGGRVLVDGKEVSVDGVTGTNTRELIIRIENGSIGELKADGSVNCSDVTGSVDAGGSISCDKVSGNVDAGGSVSCGDVTGDVDAGGSVRCGKVGGSVDAGGSIRHM